MRRFEEAFIKQKVVEFSQEIIHHMRAGERPRFLLYLHSGGIYKSPEVRTSVSRLSCRLKASCVFTDICRLVFLRQTGVYRLCVKWLSVIDSNRNWWR